MTPPITDALAADALATLRGLHLPQSVGLWPLAPGWWIALALLIGLLVAVGALLRSRRASLGRHALLELDQLVEEREDMQWLAVGISRLLRRVAVSRFGRARVASLYGSRWEHFLSQTSPRDQRRRQALTADMGNLLARAPYAPPGFLAASGVPDEGRMALVQATRDWVRWNT